MKPKYGHSISTDNVEDPRTKEIIEFITLKTNELRDHFDATIERLLVVRIGKELEGYLTGRSNRTP